MYIYFSYQPYKEKSFRNHEIKALQKKLKQGTNADQIKAILYTDKNERQISMWLPFIKWSLRNSTT